MSNVGRGGGVAASAVLTLIEVGEFAVIEDDVGSKVIDATHGDGEGEWSCVNNVVVSV